MRVQRLHSLDLGKAAPKESCGQMRPGTGLDSCMEIFSEEDGRRV